MEDGILSTITLLFNQIRHIIKGSRNSCGCLIKASVHLLSDCNGCKAEFIHKAIFTSTVLGEKWMCISFYLNVIHI